MFLSDCVSNFELVIKYVQRLCLCIRSKRDQSVLLNNLHSYGKYGMCGKVDYSAFFYLWLVPFYLTSNPIRIGLLPFTLNHRQIACDFLIWKGRNNMTKTEKICIKLENIEFSFWVN